MKNNIKILNQEDNLFVQSFVISDFLAELSKNNFVSRECFEHLNFERAGVKDTLLKTGIDNQGCMLMSLYAMLVVPKALFENKYRKEFEDLNLTIERIKSKATSTYKWDDDGIDFVRHIRNAVSHARVEFVGKVSVTFTDILNHRNDISKNQKCEITIPLNKIPVFIGALKDIFITFINDPN